MKILFLTTKSKNNQGDYLELSILLGLKEILGNSLIEIPKKDIIYGDYSSIEKNKLHGKGFTLLSESVLDFEIDRTNLLNSKFEAVIIGCGHQYGEKFNLSEIKKYSKNIWVLDGHDLYGIADRKIYFEKESVIGIQFIRSFKRELIELPDVTQQVYPTGFGIPIKNIREINLLNKNQLFQSTAPDASLFRIQNDLGGALHHKFNDEEEYYNDIANSWFGLTCKKGGWDCLRHYEILASGTLLLFRDYKYKPANCSPQELPCLSYSSIEELYRIVERLLPNGVPSVEYFQLLKKQRDWLFEKGTTRSRAQFILDKIKSEKSIDFVDLKYYNFYTDKYSAFMFWRDKFIIKRAKKIFSYIYKGLFK